MFDCYGEGIEKGVGGGQVCVNMLEELEFDYLIFFFF